MMNKKIIFILILTTTIFSAGKVGTAVYRWAEIETGARAIAMAGSQVASGNGVYAVPYNPANLGFIDGREIIPGFEPKSSEPHVVAETIDKVVTSKEYREKLIQEQYDYVKQISDPELVMRDWENLFEKIIEKHPSINRKDSNFSLKLQNLLSNLAENLIYKRTMKEKNIQAYGKADYEKLIK